MSIWEVICLSLPPRSLYQQLPQWHKVASLSDVDGISYIVHHMSAQDWRHATQKKIRFGREGGLIF